MTATPSSSLKISVIVPLYNVERYVEQCLCSLEEQGLPQDEYEIIVVDDCSPDGSLEIVERLAERFGNIRVLRNTANMGVGPTRNRGIEAAEGEYVFFADPDDWYVPGAFKEILDCMSSHGLEVLHYGYYDYIESTACRHMIIKKYPASKLIRGYEFMSPGLYHSYVWSYAFSRRFLLKHGFRMRAVHFEDTDFIIKNLAYTSRAMYLDRPLYYYRHRKGSIIFNDNPSRNLPIMDSYRVAVDFVRSTAAIPDRAKVVKCVQDIAGYDLLGIMKGDIINRYGTWRKYVETMRELDLLPINNDKGSIERALFNLSPPMYAAYVYLFYRRRKEQC